MPADTKKPAAEKPSEQPKPTAAEQTPPTPEKAPVKAPTPEELEEQAQEFASMAFGTPAPKKPEVKKETPPEPPKEDKPAAEAPKPDAEPEKKEEKPPKGGKRFVPGKASTKEIETVARRIIAEERESEPQPEPEPTKPTEPPADIEPYLSDDDRDQLQVLSELERINPSHKGLVERQKKFLRAAAQRRADWEAKNGEGSYDPNDQAHAEFYRKNEPFIPPADFKKAERSMVATEAARRAREEAVEETRKQFEPKIREFEIEKARLKTEPLVAEAQATAVESVFQAVPEFAPLIQQGNLTEEAVNKMAELNPVVHAAVTEEAETAMALIGEVERIRHLKNNYEFDVTKPVTLSSGRVIYPHADIQNAFGALERKMSQAPREERMDEGREWIPVGEFARRKDAILKSNATPDAKRRKLEELESTTWTVQMEHIGNYLLNQSKARSVAAAKRFAAYAKPPTPPPAPVAPPPPNPSTQPKPSAKADLPRGTATVTSSDTVDNSDTARNKAEKEDEEFVSKAF